MVVKLDANSSVAVRPSSAGSARQTPRGTPRGSTGPMRGIDVAHATFHGTYTWHRFWYQLSIWRSSVLLSYYASVQRCLRHYSLNNLFQYLDTPIICSLHYCSKYWLLVRHWYLSSPMHDLSLFLFDLLCTQYKMVADPTNKTLSMRRELRYLRLSTGNGAGTAGRKF
jgi:hypothetical protein